LPVGAWKGTTGNRTAARNRAARSPTAGSCGRLASASRSSGALSPTAGSCGRLAGDRDYSSPAS
jgi:hypothetical protein